MLLIDCGHTLAGAHYTGIQRYVRRTLREAVRLLGPQGVGAIAATRERGWTAVTELPAHPLEGLPGLTLDARHAVRFDAGTHVLLADRFWHTEAWPALEALLASPARISLVVYDLFSLKHPQWFPAGVGDRFGRYLRAVLPRARQVVCLSRHVARDVAEWAAAQALPEPRLHVVAPGHSVWSGHPAPPPALPRAWRDGSQPFVLQVGTLEPRKNHHVALEALRRLWLQGSNVGLLWIGQAGWLMEHLAGTAAANPRLQWLPDCTDAQLDWCYRHAAAVLYPSAAEGYGLPLAEAAAAGARVVASDTPVHREVLASLGADATTLCAPTADAIVPVLQRLLRVPRAARRPAGVRDWSAATADLLRAIEAGPEMTKPG